LAPAVGDRPSIGDAERYRQSASRQASRRRAPGAPPRIAVRRLRPAQPTLPAGNVPDSLARAA